MYMFKIIRLTVLLLALGYVIWLSLAWLKINKTEEAHIEEWHDGLAISQQNGKYGYVNEQLKPVIHYLYDYAKPFNGERAITGIKFGSAYKYRLIDKSGTYVGDFYDEMDYLGDGLYKVRNNITGKKPDDLDYYAWQLMNGDGQIISSRSYTLMDSFNDGASRVCIKQKCGFINTSGKETIMLGQASNQEKYSRVYDYSSGRLDTRTGKNHGFSHGLAKNTKDGLIGFMNTSGKIIIPHQFTHADNFSDGLAIVKTKDGTGVIDIQGNFIIRPSTTYDEIQPYAQNVAIFKQGQYYGVLDKAGKTVVTTDKHYTSISPFDTSGVAIIQKDGLYGYMDTTGQVFIPPIYAETWSGFENGYARVSKKDDPNHIWHIDRNNKIIGKETLTYSD